ncbi:hypothetical protein GDO81_001787 [Engystomops pustulosus]|uniref:Ig-like domain-containing protein n=1 Tax=Engystomops pustulosus TaxID=76066 RepID=A0AAV7DGY8_ENGPU|nr:hypothetical protein GDO81_001787 [Engystomops pustulosus]
MNEAAIKDAKPVVTMHAPVKEDLNWYGNSTVVCVISDFYPENIKVKWLKNQVETTLNTLTDKASLTANQKYIVSSYITVSKNDWNENNVYSCVVDHPATGFHEIKNLSKSETCEIPPSSGVIQVTVVPPSYETIYLDKKAKLTCIISNMVTEDGLEVSWYERETRTKIKDIVVENAVWQSGVYSVKAIATVCADDWLKNTFECVVNHNELASPRKEILAKDNGQEPMKPTVLLYPPHQDELNRKEKVTLTCLVRGFFPKDIFVMWTSNDEVQDRNFMTTQPMEEPSYSSKKTYLIYSTLTVNFEDWSSGRSYTCLVAHESLKQQAIQKSIDKTIALILYIEEDDDIDNLWTTASTFIVLFLLSLFYSATVTLFKVK